MQSSMRTADKPRHTLARQVIKWAYVSIRAHTDATCAYVRNVRIRERLLYLGARQVDEVDV